MSKTPLRVINTDVQLHRPFHPRNNREAVQAHFETLWHRDPSQFDSFRNCSERERVKRTLAVIEKKISLQGKKVLDLGCGQGNLSRMLRDKGAIVTAVDVAKNALQAFHDIDDENINLIHDCIPHTKLDDGAFDLVLCTDIIGYLSPKEHRLFFSELARLVKKDGFVICSTAIDILSVDALDRFASLADTEFNILHWKLSYHLLWIKFLNFFKSPKRFARARQDSQYRKKVLSKRSGIGRLWFQWNSAAFIGDFWKAFGFLTSPICRFFEQNRSFLLFLEKVCHALKSRRGVSHAIFIARQRPLHKAISPKQAPSERKTKKMLWE